MLPYDKLMALPPREVRASYIPRDTILYALGLGIGAQDPCDTDELRFLYEENLQAFPTMSLVIGHPGFYLKEPQYQVDWAKVLHGEQRLTLHKPLPLAAAMHSVMTIDEVYDKGPHKGALMYTTRKLYDEADGSLVATIGSTSFLRGDGGCGGRTDSAPPPQAIPDRAPDHVMDIPTRADQALIYRLSGDYNPLHIDPTIAQRAGFDRPILHGLCTYGVAARAILKILCDNQPSRLRRFDVRFSSPAYPGETIRSEIWRLSGNTAAVRARVVERDKVVIDNGFTAWGEA